MDDPMWDTLVLNSDSVVIKQEAIDVTNGAISLQDFLVKQEEELVIEDQTQMEHDKGETNDFIHNDRQYPAASHQSLEINGFNDSTLQHSKAFEDTEEADRKLFIHLLTSWNIRKENINKLLDLGFMVNDLKIIRNEDINDLFSSSDIVTRIRFRDGVTKLKEFGIEHFGPLSTLETVDDSINANISSTVKLDSKEVPLPVETKLQVSDQIKNQHETNTLDFEDIANLLQMTTRGKHVVTHYKRYKSLSMQHHKIITDIVVDFLINRQHPLKCSDFIVWAEKIVAAFPSEKREIFFTKGAKGGRHRGKLVDRYYNVIKKLRKKGLWKTPRKLPRNSATDHNTDEKIRLQLMTCNNWNRILKYWDATFSYRIARNRTKSITEICDSWPSYNETFASELIDGDFKRLYPNLNNILFTDWNSYIQMWKQILVNRKLHDPNDVFYLRLMTEHLSDDTQNYFVFMLLHVLLPPSCTIQHVASRRTVWRPNITDSQISNIISVKTKTAVIQRISEIKSNYLKYGLDMHPFIIVIAPDIFNYTESYVYLNDHLHKTDSFLKSLDLCFKIYKTFYITYPKESVLVWQLIDRLFYKTEQAVVDPSVIQLILSLNRK